MKAVRWFGLVLALAVVPAAFLAFDVARVEAQSSDRHAAIAYSTSTGRYGYAYNYATRFDAESRAVQECGTSDARAVVWVRNGWCALAIGDNRNVYGWGWSSSSEADARQRALAAYPSTGGRIAVSVRS